MPLSKTEAVARALFKYYLPMLKVEYGIRPEWLRWPVTGNPLELDIWFPQIKVGIEVNGVQHGRPITSMQRDFADFERQQARDLWKLEECQRLGIALYRLTIFDLTEFRFGDKFRAILETASQNSRSNPAIHVAVDQARLKFNRGDGYKQLRPIFAEADRLSRQRFNPPKPKRLSWWHRLFGTR